jgi:hypothetical protein
MNDIEAPGELEQLQEDLRWRLRGRVRELRLALHEGAVLLQGQATCYYAKQLAQHFVLRMLGRTPLVNHIDVTPPPPAPEPGDAEPG